MIIYNTNFADKLFGYALSRDFIKYNTPLCDLLDDPIVGAEIDLAINFNKAIYGNPVAREEFTNTLVLSSGILDPGTVNFWTKKMFNYPIFRSEIERIKTDFNYLLIRSPKNKFQESLLNAVKDCLNSPCNLFSPISNNIGSLTKTSSMLTPNTTLPIGSLKDTLKTITAGVDHTVFTKLPTIFQGTITRVGQLMSDTWSDVLTTVTNKDNSEELIRKAQTGQLRTVPNGKLYTPDVGTYLLFSEMSTNLLTNIQQELGSGCFRRYQYENEYNPFSNDQNRATPSTIRDGNVNGAPFSQLPSNQPMIQPRFDSNNSLGVGSVTTPPQPYIPGDVNISPEITVGPAYDRARGINVKYTVFAAWIDESNKIVWVDDLSTAQTGNKNDDLTLQGTNNHSKFIMTPSLPGTHSFEDHVNALNNKVDSPSIVGGYLRSYLQDKAVNPDLSKIDGMNNQGVALSYARIKEFLGINITPRQVVRLQKQNQMFAVITYNGVTNFVQMVDAIGDKNGPRIDFTPYAFWKVFGKYPGTNDLANPAPARSYIRQLGDWREVTYKIHPNCGNFTLRIAIGNKQDIEQRIASGTLSLSENEAISIGLGSGNVKYSSSHKSATRNKPVDPRLFNIISQAAAATKLDIQIFSGGQDAKGQGSRRTGSVRHDNGKAADIWLYNNGVQLNSNKATDIPLLESFVRAAKAAGATSAGMGPGYMGGVGLHIDIASAGGVWGKTHTRVSAPAWLSRAMS